MSADASREHVGSAKERSGRARPHPGRVRLPSPPRAAPGRYKTQIVVLEEGALNGALPARPAQLDETDVVAQSRGETLRELADRTIHRIVMLERSDAEVAQVSVFLGSDFGQSTMAARHMVGSAVLAYANSARRKCELVFVGRWEDRELRAQLWELVESLVTEPGSANVPIRLRFVHRPSHASS